MDDVLVPLSTGTCRYVLTTHIYPTSECTSHFRWYSLLFAIATSTPQHFVVACFAIGLITRHDFRFQFQARDEDRSGPIDDWLETALAFAAADATQSRLAYVRGRSIHQFMHQHALLIHVCCCVEDNSTRLSTLAASPTRIIDWVAL